jgi:hypothetical protein
MSSRDWPERIRDILDAIAEIEHSSPASTPTPSPRT